ncbi:MAG TPA: glycoside hydrolase family 127 protein [Cyclobacteriaceae bacterium]
MRTLNYLKTNLILVVIAIVNISQAIAQPKLQLFQLADVRLNAGPFYDAQQTDLNYILALDVDRLLTPFIHEAGLPLKKESYGNWENTGLDGHIGGHYLSALSLMYASTGNAELKNRLDYMVDQLAICQQKNGNGYVGGIPGGLAMWEEIKKGKIEPDNFSLNHKWVPLYNIHKLYAGLRDAYLIAGNEKAKQIFINLCNWFVDVTKNLSDQQIQDFLRSEHGGMNEVFADAYEMTGNITYLELAKKLSDQRILTPLIDHRDALTGLHANTQIPKVVGFKKIGDLAHDNSWISAADFFWNTVVKNRSVAIGGNSVREHFHPANDFTSMIESNQGPETCNTYNMLRLTKALYLTNPKASFMDYYERAVYNHILSSQHPQTGGFVYFTPMRPQHYRVYSSPQKSFWCCVGSGLENHGKYGELIYAHNENDLFVNLFISSTLHWKQKKITLQQKTDFPNSETSTLTLSLQKPSKFVLNIRKPSWVKDGNITILVNGKTIATIKSDDFMSIDRKWKNGDVVKITLPMTTSVEYLPDGSPWGAFLHGPIVLAAATGNGNLDGLIADDSRMGHVASGKYYPIDESPVILKNTPSFVNNLTATGTLEFSAEKLIYPERFKSLKLVPFYTIHDQRYIIYWNITTQEDWTKLKAKLEAKERQQLKDDSLTIDMITLGEQQPEVEHSFAGEKSEAGSTNGLSWRNTSGWVSYNLNDKTGEAKLIRIMFAKGGPDRKFSIKLNDKEFQRVELPNNDTSESSSFDYVIPTNLISGNNKTIKIKIEATPGYNTGRIYSIRLMR